MCRARREIIATGEEGGRGLHHSASVDLSHAPAKRDAILILTKCHRARETKALQGPSRGQAT